MHENAFIVVMIVGIAAHVGTFITQEYPLARAPREALRQHASGKASPDDEVVEHLNSPPRKPTSPSTRRSGGCRYGPRCCPTKSGRGRRRCSRASRPAFE